MPKALTNLVDIAQAEAQEETDRLRILAGVKVYTPRITTTAITVPLLTAMMTLMIKLVTIVPLAMGHLVDLAQANAKEETDRLRTLAGVKVHTPRTTTTAIPTL